MSKIPRIMIAAPRSGSGKTMLTCGILMALKRKGLRLTAFKCGPDYIDPMFHERVIGTPSYNLDTYFTDEATTRYLLEKHGSGSDLSVMEGVMGYYDGAGNRFTASSYHLAQVTKTPVILVVDAKGMSTSIVAQIFGYQKYREDSNLAGVILNRISPALYPEIKGQVEAQLGIAVLGYLETKDELRIKSRHLGLVLPEEVEQLRKTLSLLAKEVERTIDLNALLEIGRKAEETVKEDLAVPKLKTSVRIGVARDEAFCFYYKDNLELMEEMGARLHYFSPCRDQCLPEGMDALLLGGGYPELYAETLSRNVKMLDSIRCAEKAGMAILAECGGFMYLKEVMQDMNGTSYPMAGICKGKVRKTENPQRFGYIEVVMKRDCLFGKEGTAVKGHEFHYFDSTNNGRDAVAKKPFRERSWECMETKENKMCGFPHLYYYSNREAVFHMLQMILEKRGDKICWQKQ